MSIVYAAKLKWSSLEDLNVMAWAPTPHLILKDNARHYSQHPPVFGINFALIVAGSREHKLRTLGAPSCSPYLGLNWQTRALKSGTLENMSELPFPCVCEDISRHGWGSQEWYKRTWDTIFSGSPYDSSTSPLRSSPHSYFFSRFSLAPLGSPRSGSSHPGWWNTSIPGTVYFRYPRPPVWVRLILKLASARSRRRDLTAL
jgi:hypothetical protein